MEGWLIRTLAGCFLSLDLQGTKNIMGPTFHGKFGKIIDEPKSACPLKRYVILPLEARSSDQVTWSSFLEVGNARKHRFQPHRGTTVQHLLFSLPSFILNEESCKKFHPLSPLPEVQFWTSKLSEIGKMFEGRIAILDESKIVNQKNLFFVYCCLSFKRKCHHLSWSISFFKPKTVRHTHPGSRFPNPTDLPSSQTLSSRFRPSWTWQVDFFTKKTQKNLRCF